MFQKMTPSFKLKTKNPLPFKDENLLSDHELWQESEDSFLRKYCHIKRDSWGSLYTKKFTEDFKLFQPKFNFIRLTQENLSYDHFLDIIKEHSSFFIQNKIPLIVKVSKDLVLSPKIMNLLEKTKSSLAYLKIDPRDFSPMKKDNFLIKKCHGRDELETYWSIKCYGRSEEYIKNNPAYPLLVQSFEAGLDIYLLYVKGVAVSGKIVEDFENGQNLRSAVTHPLHRRKGYIHFLNSNILNRHSGPFLTQVNHLGPMFDYYTSLPGTDILKIEQWYTLNQSLLS